MNSNIVFKVQVGLGRLSPANFEDIDELSFFTLPSGNKMYFSGGAFRAYQNAEKEMERVKALGYEAAVLTAFKQGQELPMSSREVKELIARQKEHEEYVLVRAEEIKEEERSRLKLEEEQRIAREKSRLRLKEKEAEERRKRKMSLEEFDRLSGEHLSGNDSGDSEPTSKASFSGSNESEEDVIYINRNNSNTEVSEKEASRKVIDENPDAKLISSIEDIVAEEKMVKKENLQLLVEERPVYMICIAQFNEGEKVVQGKEWGNISQVVYKHTCRNVNYFVFGSFTNTKEASKALAAAKSMGLNDARIVGYYMNSVTSVNLATQLMEIFDSYQD